MDKVEIFFELLSAVYGRAKIEAQWPTERDEQIVRALVRSKVESMELSEIRAAIDNARIQKANDMDGWAWPDVDLILAGAKRYANASHRNFLPEPERDLLPAAERSRRARALVSELFPRGSL